MASSADPSEATSFTPSILAVSNQSGEAETCLATLVMTGEQCGFSVQSNRPDQFLDLVGLKPDATIRQEGLHCNPLALEAEQRLTEARF